MADKQSDLVPGTLDMLILKTLDLEPMHGYGISARIEQMSKGVFRVNAGSLAPVADSRATRRHRIARRAAQLSGDGSRRKDEAGSEPQMNSGT
jgi:hypothetical protein